MVEVDPQTPLIGADGPVPSYGLLDRTVEDDRWQGG
jgi:hypothetical protein